MQMLRALWLTAIACGGFLGQISGANASRLPTINLVNHYEPLSYNPGPLREKHDRIARGIIYEPHIQTHFRAYGRDFHLHLRPSRSVFSTGVRFKVDGKVTDVYDPATFYEGVIEGDESSHVTGHVIDGVFSGVIRTAQETYHVEKTHSYFRDRRDLSFHSFIYRESDVEFPKQPSSCGISGQVLDWMNEVQSSAVLIHDPKDNPRPAILTKLLRKTRGKRALTSTGGNFCHMRVSIDHLFFEDIGGGDEINTFAEVVTTFNRVQEIYMRTDFDDDGEQDFITPSIQEINILRETDPGYQFGAPNISVNVSVIDYLDLWSQEDHTQFCLAMLWTNYDFIGGMLGLAWVAQPPGGNRGGVCEGRVQLNVGERSLNTGVVTFSNYGNRQPRVVNVITIAHQLGHSFGSRHDPSSTDTCSPGSSGGGNYIMYPRATNGQQSNNNDFSPCSRREIRDVLVTSKSDCFSNDAFCGNGIVEEGEECDDDKCCNNTICMLLPGRSCSTQQQCCDDNCNVITTPSTTCRAASDCAEQAICDGENGACPRSTPRTAGTLCNNGSNVCDADGNCVGSYCLQFPVLEECQCTAEGGDESRLCHVCCQYQGSCRSTFELTTLDDPDIASIEGRVLEPGRSCNNFEGYCNQMDPQTRVSRCIAVDNDEALNELIELLPNSQVALTVGLSVDFSVINFIAFYILLFPCST